MSPYKNHRWREGLKLSLLNIPLRKHWKPLLLGGLLLLSFLLKLNHLGHQRLRGVDECCHALVAKNLLKHPLKPILIETPYLLYAETAWGENHVWLHKPILPLWQITLSYRTYAFFYESPHNMHFMQHFDFYERHYIMKPIFSARRYK